MVRTPIAWASRLSPHLQPAPGWVLRLPPLGLSWGLCVAWGPDTHGTQGRPLNAQPLASARSTLSLTQKQHRPGQDQGGPGRDPCSEHALRPARVACAGSDRGSQWTAIRSRGRSCWDL